MRAIVTAGVVVAVGLNLWGCSGSGYGSGNSGNPGAPTPPSPSTSGVVTVNVVGINGALSFSPNPATLPAGQMIVWHNVDNITHHVVFNDGSVDTGNLGSGGVQSTTGDHRGGWPVSLLDSPRDGRQRQSGHDNTTPEPGRIFILMNVPAQGGRDSQIIDTKATGTAVNFTADR